MVNGTKHWHLKSVFPRTPKDLSLPGASSLSEEDKGEECPAHFLYILGALETPHFVPLNMPLVVTRTII